MDISRVASKARDKAMSEAAERAKAWAEAKVKEKSEITKIAVEASEKVEAKAEVRVTEKDYSEKREAE